MGIPGDGGGLGSFRERWGRVWEPLGHRWGSGWVTGGGPRGRGGDSGSRGGEIRSRWELSPSRRDHQIPSHCAAPTERTPISPGREPRRCGGVTGRGPSRHSRGELHPPPLPAAPCSGCSPSPPPPGAFPPPRELPAGRRLVPRFPRNETPPGALLEPRGRRCGTGRGGEPFQLRCGPGCADTERPGGRRRARSCAAVGCAGGGGGQQRARRPHILPSSHPRASCPRRSPTSPHPHSPVLASPHILMPEFPSPTSPHPRAVVSTGPHLSPPPRVLTSPCSYVSRSPKHPRIPPSSHPHGPAPCPAAPAVPSQGGGGGGGSPSRCCITARGR